jgi:sulfate adenylyltransferase
MVPAEAYDEMKAYASRLPSIQISTRFVNDLELIATGVFSPLDRFMDREDYEHVINDMRLANGFLFPIPVTLPVSSDTDLHLDGDIAIRNNKFELLAIMTIEEIYEWDQTEFAEHLLSTQYSRHPLVNEIQNWGSLNISGCIRVLQLPRHYDFKELRLNPYQIRERITSIAPDKVIAVQPIEPLLPDLEMVHKQGLDNVEAIFLLQLAVGTIKIGDYEYFTRTRIYRDLVKNYFFPNQVLLSLLPLSTRFAGPRESLWQAIIQRNFGTNHLLVSQPKIDSTRSESGRSINNSNETVKLLTEFSHELGIKILPINVPLNGSDPDQLKIESKVKRQTSLATRSASGNFNNYTNSPWLKMQQEISEKLTEARSPQHNKGVCIWFTGLSGSGKSTTAEILSWILLEHGRKVAVLDGDVVRTHLSKGLGFSKKDRDINVRRIGFVSSGLVELGGIVICAVVSPYRETREEVRGMIGSDKFVEVYVDTPIAVCEDRDVKGMYAKARNGDLVGFTGVDDPYEPPLQPEITLDTVNHTPIENAHFILDYLIEWEIILSNNSQNQIIE